jgi:hypothetical protein
MRSEYNCRSFFKKKNAKRTTWYGKWQNVERSPILSHVILFSYNPENDHRSSVGGKKIHPLHVLSSGTSITPWSIGSCMYLASKQSSIALVSWTGTHLCTISFQNCPWTSQELQNYRLRTQVYCCSYY